MAIVSENTYDVGEQEVFLAVKVGEGQFGGSRVILDGKTLYTGQGIEHLSLGSGGSLAGKILRVVTVVTDTNPSTNNMIVTHMFEGGAEAASFPLSSTVSSEGESVVFDAKFTFNKV